MYAPVNDPSHRLLRRTIIDDTLGANLLGVIAASCLWGVIVQQSYRYYCTFPSDPWFIRSVVFVTLLIETTQQGVISFQIYSHLITDYGNLEVTGAVDFSNTLPLFSTATTALLVKIFFVFRIYRLAGEKIWYVVPIVLTVLAEFATTYAFGIIASQKRFFVQLAPFLSLSSSTSILGAVADILISASLCYLLLPQRNTLFPKSRTLIDRIIIFSTANGLLTSLCAIAVVVATHQLPDSDWSVAFFASLGRLHLNSLLTTLNARGRRREESSSQWHSVSFPRSREGVIGSSRRRHVTQLVQDLSAEANTSAGSRQSQDGRPEDHKFEQLEMGTPPPLQPKVVDPSTP